MQPPKEIKKAVNGLTDQQAEALLYDWSFWGRSNQLAPAGQWRNWLLLAGRGFGKTRTGGEWVRQIIEAGQAQRVALVAPTAADVRDVMVEGESGILAICPPWNRPSYEPSKRRLTWPSGAIATTYSADEPERLRGPQHDAAWCDELASWRRPEAWDMLMFGLRLGDDPRCVVTTTPKPLPHIKELLKAETTHVTRGSTYENRANLADAFFEQIIRKYEGTRLGRQELLAELLEDVPGALWNRELLEMTRVTKPPDIKRIVVALDPAVTSGEESNETGIVVCGLGSDGHGYTLDDVTLRGTPAEWGRAGVAAYYKWNADRMIAETNNGGDMIEHTIRTIDSKISFKQVRASRGKHTRAEPVAALYEQKRCHQVGYFADMEDQLCGWVPGDDSPDRLDALVWAYTELMVGAQGKIEMQENPFY